jgi:hypothetical protein
MVTTTSSSGFALIGHDGTARSFRKVDQESRSALFEPADLGQAARPILTVHRFDLLRDGASGVLYQLSFSAS